MIRCMFALLVAAVAPAALAQITLHHVPGLAYSGDGKRLIIPSHQGLAVYENGKWSKAPGPEHDYMGFVATAKNLYSSGHPAPRSGLPEPFGLIRSRDRGKSWDRLGLEGETDFHLMAASWNTNAIYVWNPEPSSRIKTRGLHSTMNEGFTWQRAAAAGLAGKGHSLAAFFDLDGAHIWYAAYGGRPTLSRFALKEPVPIGVALPALTNDAVAYIAQNPARRSEYAIATFERDVYVSKDGGKTWSQIAARGTTR